MIDEQRNVEFMATQLLKRLRQTAIGHHELISAALITARTQGADAPRRFACPDCGLLWIVVADGFTCPVHGFYRLTATRPTGQPGR